MTDQIQDMEAEAKAHNMTYQMVSHMLHPMMLAYKQSQNFVFDFISKTPNDYGMPEDAFADHLKDWRNAIFVSLAMSMIDSMILDLVGESPRERREILNDIFMQLDKMADGNTFFIKAKVELRGNTTTEFKVLDIQ
ncbi:MAG: hypothetical protein RLZZ157_87 [Pseudomonadota bacterium]|jgi:hypothetical protein